MIYLIYIVPAIIISVITFKWVIDPLESDKFMPTEKVYLPLMAGLVWPAVIIAYILDKGE
jgi:hypothetical protein